MAKANYKTGFLDRDHKEWDRTYKKGTPVLYYRSKDYDDEKDTWTGQFRTHYICKDQYGNPGSFTIFYQDLFVENN